MAKKKADIVDVNAATVNTDPDDTSEPVEVTLDEARAEDAANQGQDTSSSTPKRPMLKWTENMITAMVDAAGDYYKLSGSMPSAQDLYELLVDNPEFAHVVTATDANGGPLLTPQKVGIAFNGQRAKAAQDVKNGLPGAVPPPLSRTRYERKATSNRGVIAALWAEKVGQGTEQTAQ